MTVLRETPHCRGVPALPHRIHMHTRTGTVTVVLGEYDAGGFFVCAVRDDGTIYGSSHSIPSLNEYGGRRDMPVDAFLGYVASHKGRAS